ncbi:MAG: hypothetical protein AAGF93_01700 [Cyanobacteria bacterium P01_H01_bin.105]
MTESLANDTQNIQYPSFEWIAVEYYCSRDLHISISDFKPRFLALGFREQYLFGWLWFEGFEKLFPAYPEAIERDLDGFEKLLALVEKTGYAELMERLDLAIARFDAKQDS